MKKLIEIQSCDTRQALRAPGTMVTAVFPRHVSGFTYAQFFLPIRPPLDIISIHVRSWQGHYITVNYSGPSKGQGSAQVSTEEKFHHYQLDMALELARRWAQVVLDNYTAGEA